MPRNHKPTVLMKPDRDRDRHYDEARLLRMSAALWAHIDRVKERTGKSVNEILRGLVRDDMAAEAERTRLRNSA